ncbi:MAG: envelope stress response membrane protein PspC [Alphaproteobacteria bacterium]|jgi:phage shock protein C
MSVPRFRWQGCGWSAAPRSQDNAHRPTSGAGWFSHIRLYRHPDEGKIRGVCAGIADYTGLPVLLVRLGWLLVLFWNPPLVAIGYFLLAWLLPVRPADLFANEAEETFWQQVRREPVGTVHELRHRFRTNEQRLRGIEAYVTSPEFELNRELRGL